MELEEHLSGHDNKTHLDPGSLELFQDLGYKSFLDVGCGPGGMVELAEANGFDAFGIDGDYTLKRYNDNNFLIHDFTKGPAPLDRKFDICWCVEFVEHVYEKYIPNYVQAIQNCKNLAMTHALEGQTGYHHVNCKNPDYWIKTMANYGFKFDPEMTRTLRKRSRMGTSKKFRFMRRSGLFFTNINESSVA